MRKGAVVLVATAAAAALALAACSSSKKGTTGSSSPGAGGGSGSSSASGSASGKPQVGVILPDTTTSNRYTLYDAPLLKKAFDAAGVPSTIQNAHGSSSTFVADAQAMITQGVKVLLIDPADPQTGISVEKSAQAAGVQVIDYDRVNLGGSASYYVSFDNVKVGELQAQGLLNCPGIGSKPNIIELNGGTDIDNNAVLFKQGAHNIWSQKGIKPKVETDVKGWDNTVAATDFQQAYTQDPSVQGVLAANDGIAAAAISTLKQHHQQIPVTGQDATIQGIQFILTGDQCLTIFKDVSKEADAASKLAIDIIHGDKAAADALATGSLHDPQNGRTIKSVLLVPEVITKSNIQDVIKAGALTKADICKGIQAACTKAGL
ncbi:MAG TPA: substrate-binding domain-containing protein [Jatrophihabitans sp.]|nr:substrate-binding domain-containing protein [Jatrophihabitans sp.]